MTGESMMRLVVSSGVAGVMFSMYASLLLASAAAVADNAPLPTRIVDLTDKVDGVHPGFRAFHAKGAAVNGTFRASSEASRLSSATLFSGTPIAVIARYS